MPFCPVCEFSFGDGAEICPHDGALLVVSDPLIGRVLDGKYRIDARLGAGGMGAVYRGTQIALQRPVAIKVILGSGAGTALAVRRFEREALAVARLRHPHIVAVHDYGIAYGIGAYLVLELLSGSTLRDEIRERQRLSTHDAVTWFMQICSAVHAAHTAGLVHRDLKPENIVLEPTDDKRTARVLDFGIAKFLAETEIANTPLTGAGGILGTPYYMSPEQCRGESVGPASDIYALGCVLYEMLTGRPPFTGTSTPALLYQHVSVAPASPAVYAPEIPPALCAAVLKAIEKDADARFASVSDFRAAVSAPLAAHSVETLPLAPGLQSEGVAGASHRSPNNLPAELSTFIGRHRELAEASALARSTRLLSIAGPGGIGKTRFALQIAGSMLDRFADGVWLVELDALTEPGHVDDCVARTFGLGDEAGRSARDVLIAHLRSRNALIVLDNCEHLIDACADTAKALLRGCSGLTIVTSTREPLGLSGETVYQLEPLQIVDGAGARLAVRAIECDAVRLFVERAQASRSTWTLTDEDTTVVIALCERLDGIPLAIELAAARINALSASQILERLGTLTTLSSGDRSQHARHRTLDATIAWSYDLLNEDERRILQYVSVFSGGWTLEGAESIAGTMGFVPGAALESLVHLVEKSMIVMDEGVDGARYRMLETIRTFAAERLRASGDRDRLSFRHHEWILEFLLESFADFGGPNHERWHRRVDADHANALAALAWGRDRRELAERNLEIAVSLGAFWETYGRWNLGRHWLEGTLDECEEVDDHLRARALFRLASLAHRQGTYAESERLYRECLVLIRDTDRTRMVAEALSQLGRVVGSLGRLDEERELLEEALALHRQSGSSITIASALHALGETSRAKGNFDEAERWLGESLEMFRRAGFSQGISVVLLERARVALASGDAEAAYAKGTESLAVARAGAFEILVAQSQRIVAEALLAKGEIARARNSFGDALRRSQDLGAVDDIVFSLEGFARFCATTGDDRRAYVLAEFASRKRAEIGDPRTESEQRGLQGLSANAREALGEELADRLCAEAAEMSVEAAISLALGGARDEPETMRNY